VANSKPIVFLGAGNRNLIAGSDCKTSALIQLQTILDGVFMYRARMSLELSRQQFLKFILYLFLFAL
jgi:hypothetical protein